MKRTSWWVLVIGIVITLIGIMLIRGALGDGMTGFGIATIVFGILDMLRAPVKT